MTILLIARRIVRPIVCSDPLAPPHRERGARNSSCNACRIVSPRLRVNSDRSKPQRSSPTSSCATNVVEIRGQLLVITQILDVDILRWPDSMAIIERCFVPRATRSRAE